jgi:assimilatory nitrate reductase catalytic subunit
LFTERFPTPDGRAKFVRVDHREPAEQPDQEYPYVLTTGRVMQQYQSGAQTRRVKSLVLQQPTAFAEIHPDLARLHDVVDSDWIELRTRRGNGVFQARVTDVVRPDTIFAPFHWGGQSNVNALTNPVLDRFSKMPAFKVCAVALRRIGPSGEDLMPPDLR